MTAHSIRVCSDASIGNRGSSLRLGATVCAEGTNFSLFSRNATAVELLLFDHREASTPARTLRLDPKINKTYHYWHVFVPGVRAGQIYGYRVHGPFEPEHGLRFDADKVLLDPYGKAVAIPAGYDRQLASEPGDNAGTAMKSVVADTCAYDWEGDVGPKVPFSRTIIYEMHVRGFTRHPSSGVSEDRRGTYAGLIEKIPYLKELGVTAVELLPVYQYDEQDAPAGFRNYWGYAPVAFFAPHAAYSSRQDPLGVLDEFRDMVKALHRAGIEVILDVVYNHTAEGNHQGPILGFRGLQNDAYYLLETQKSVYSNYSGCGNTLNASNPFVRRLILDSLHYWVEEMHVDGFRFDLASILSRDASGRPLENPPVLWDIETDPALSGIKLIAEAWDAAGLYQVGSFVGDSWKEWNGRFRDDVRGFLKGDNGIVTRLASRLLGSPDIFAHEEREPEQSINFVTCHDGFTLNDLVSFNHKHNEANGENNRDGSDNNLSWNCGVEGPTEDPAIEHLRNRQVKNFLALTFLSTGVPMLLMGDETRHTQGGNNNAYGQDNQIGWLDWDRAARHADVLRFVQHLTRARLRRDAAEDLGLTLNQVLQRARIHWHGVILNEPDWREDSHSIALTAWGLRGSLIIHLMINAYHEPLTFQVPPVPAEFGEAWYRWIDTSLASPHDISFLEEATTTTAATCLVQPRSIVAMVALSPDRR